MTVSGASQCCLQVAVGLSCEVNIKLCRTICKRMLNRLYMRHAVRAACCFENGVWYMLLLRISAGLLVESVSVMCACAGP